MKKLIDLQQLKALSRQNNNFIKEILEVYLTNAPADLEKLGSCIVSKDWSMVRYYAHKLKSSSFTIGFTRGFELFQHIENTIKDEGDIRILNTIYDQAVETCEIALSQVKEEMTQYV